MRRVYDVNWRMVVSQLTPWFLRKQRNIDWLMAMLAPLVSLYTQAKAFFGLKLKEANYNSQTITLLRLVNDLHDPEFRAIKFEDQPKLILPEYYFFEDEGKTPQFLYFEAESGTDTFTEFAAETDEGPDVIVKIPFYCKEQRIKTLINKLTAAGVDVEYQIYTPPLPAGLTYPVYV